jgi:hypothetical protein
MDLELGSDMDDACVLLFFLPLSRSDPRSSADDTGGTTRREAKAQKGKAAALKGELARLLAQPLVARGVSTRYITSGSAPIADDLVAGQGAPCRPSLAVR